MNSNKFSSLRLFTQGGVLIVFSFLLPLTVNEVWRSSDGFIYGNGILAVPVSIIGAIIGISSIVLGLVRAHREDKQHVTKKYISKTGILLIILSLFTFGSYFFMEEISIPRLILALLFFVGGLYYRKISSALVQNNQNQKNNPSVDLVTVILILLGIFFAIYSYI